VERSELIAKMAEHSFLDQPRLESLYDRAVEAIKLVGCFVECGCGPGGSSAVLAGALGLAKSHRRLVVCDTFEGLPPPDVTVDRANGWDDATIMSCTESAAGSEGEIDRLCNLAWRGVSLETRRGLYADTLKYWPYGPIALLHADADWYYSTKQILDGLWRHLAPGALVIFDDYHFWSGCRKAVDEFFAANPPAPAWTTVSCSVWGRKPVQVEQLARQRDSVAQPA
jgi:hypothetical protein